jgi:hypothetical protein
MELDITSYLDKTFVTTDIFIDLKKTFDIIDHSILIKKPCHYGVWDIASSWIKYDLTNRKQFVVYGGVCSDYRTMLCGILQGSILGPILFFYTSMIWQILKLKFILFADGTNVLYAAKGITV